MKHKENICNYCKWVSMHTCTGRSCEEAIEAAEKERNKMQRLTYKNPDGTFGLNNGYDMHKVPTELMGAIWKLKDYEETGLDPEEAREYTELGLTLEQLKEIDKLYLEKCEEVNRIKAELGGLKEQKGEVLCI